MKLTLQNIETRTVDIQTKYPKYVIRGYAVAPNVPHVYKTIRDKKGNVLKSFKSLFTQNAINRVNEQIKHKSIFIDAMHEVAANLNSKNIIEQIRKKTNNEINDELNVLESNLKMKEVPLFKPVKLEVLDKGLFAEVESNPYFAEVDEIHEKQYKAIMGSLLNGSINGMSFNFRTNSVIVEDDIEKIDDIEVYGISLTSGAALGSDSPITEVFMRSIQELVETREEKKMQPEQKQEFKGLSEEEITKIVENRLNEERKQREIEEQKKAQAEQYKKLQEEVETLKKQKEELEKNQVVSRGLAAQPANNQERQALDEKQLVEKIRDLSPGEAIYLSAQPDVKKVIPTLIKVQEMPNTRNPFKPETRFVPIPPEMRDLHKALTRKEEGDLVFKNK